MESTVNNKGSFYQSSTAKAIFITFLSLVLLIPGCMVQELILERQLRSEDAIQQINAKWSKRQTISGVVMTIPYVCTVYEKEVEKKEERLLYITPEEVNMEVKLIPEERHYGIYKTILYRSQIDIEGYFGELPLLDNGEFIYKNATLLIGISDLKGVTENIQFTVNNHLYTARPAEFNPLLKTVMRISLHEEDVVPGEHNRISFKGDFQLKGSSGISFIPMGRASQVKIEGEWSNPGFTGEFAPDYTLDNERFAASWKVMDFNRSLPATWVEGSSVNLEEATFGVNLINPVDHYQQNMRSAKYALMFIALTFAVFFFVELLTHKKIHFIQYLLVGIALILFYSLLLSISEQINFGVAYLIASIATIVLISLYAYSFFKNKTHTTVLGGLLVLLYSFLYVILQLEDIALLIGSIGLFIILAAIMYFSRKINWYESVG